MARAHPAFLAPREAFARLGSRDGLAFLDGGPGEQRSILAWEPVRVERIRADDAGDPVAKIANFVDRERAHGRTTIGAIAYELGAWIEPNARLPRDRSPTLAVLSSYETAYVHDSRTGEWTPPLPAMPDEAPPASSAKVLELAPEIDFPAYRAGFDRAIEWIRAGDVYQVNLTFGFAGRLDGSPLDLHRRLSGRNAVPHGAWLDLGDERILSYSPECFLRIDADRRIETRPIKGTRRRAASAAEDEALRAELAADEKERAEHVMIVDLERNDLGRVCRTGSIRVDPMLRVASFETVHHLESTIRGELRPEAGTADVLRATFPGGSITGAPKVRAMEIIAELEPAPRGFYTGTIAAWLPDGSMTASIAIRTAVVRDGAVRYGVGGGIVADSDARREWEECHLKASVFREAG